MLTKNRLYLTISVLCSITSVFYVWNVLAPDVGQLLELSIFFDAFIKVQAITMIILIFYDCDDNVKTWSLCLASLGVMYLFDYATGAVIIGTQFVGFFYNPHSLIFTPALYACTLLFTRFMRRLPIKTHDDARPMRRAIKYAAIILALVAAIASFSPYMIHEAYLDGKVKQQELELIKQYKAVFTDGTGTKNDPFHVTNAKELSTVRHLLSFHFIQTADIHLSDADVQDTGGYWEPIGTSQNFDQHFTGSYDGNGYSIYGLKLTGEVIHGDRNISYPEVGLFGFTKCAILKNIRIEQPVYEHRMERYTCFGFLAGEVSRSVVENCSINADYLENVGTTGGLIGSAIGSRIAECEVTITKMAVGKESAVVEVDPIYADNTNVLDESIVGIVGSMSRSYGNNKLPIDAEEGIFDCVNNISDYMVFDE